MRRVLSIALVMLSACAAQQLKPKSPVAEPQIDIEQVSSVASAARDMSGNIVVRYQVHVKNVANQTITLKRIDMNSIGYGAYTMRATSLPYNVAIGPGEEGVVDFWTTGAIILPSAAGANSWVTVRAVALFDSGAGQLQTVTTQQVHPPVQD